MLPVPCPTSLPRGAGAAGSFALLSSCSTLLAGHARGETQLDAEALAAFWGIAGTPHSRAGKL